MGLRASAPLCTLAAASVLATCAFAQTTVNWQGTTDINWFNGANWSSSATPTSSQHASVGASGTVSTSGLSQHVQVAGLDVSSSSANLVFDFGSSGYNLYLGTAASSWSAGLVDFHNSGGVYGNGTANTSLTIGSGAELRYSTTPSITRNLYNLTVSNSGTIQNQTGTLSITYTNLTNQSGGVINANGSEIDFGYNTTLNNLGTIQASGAAGKLYFNNSLTSAQLGNVSLSNGAQAYLGGTLDNTGTTLAGPTGGSLQLNGGTIVNGTLSAGAVAFTTNGGTLNNATLADNLTLPASGSLTLTGNATFSGATGTLGNYSSLYWKQGGQLAGKSLTFGTGSRIYTQGAGSSLTLGPTTTAAGNIQIVTDGSAGAAITNQGTITHNVGSGSISAPSFTNTGNITASSGSSLTLSYYYGNYTFSNGSGGIITADGANTTIYLDGNLANQGTLVAQNSGTLIFDGGYYGAQTTANLGNVQIANGGHVYIAGTLDNSNATLAAPTGGTYELHAGTIANGTIGAGALTFTTSGGTLSNATLADNLTLAASASVAFTGNTTFSGASGTLGNYSSLYWKQGGQLTGKSLTFGTGSRILVQGSGNALTLDSATSAQGDIQITTDGSTGAAITTQGNITHNVGGGSISAPSFTNTGNITASSGTSLTLSYYYGNYTFSNGSTGIITADGANTTIYLDGNLANHGTLIAQNSGTLIFDGGYYGAQTTANLGNVQIATGGHAYIAGTLDNSNATLTAPTGGTYELHAGTIANGSIGSGALTFTTSGGTLSNAALADNLTLPASASVTFTGNTTFSGASGTLGNYSSLYWKQAGQLTGKSLTFGTGSRIQVQGSGNALTLDSATSAQGDIQITTDGSTGSAITNQGNITHSVGGGSISAPSFTNTGNITASSGSSLTLSNYYGNYTLSNGSTGIITADGANTTIYVDGNLANHGTLIAQNSGTLIFDGGYYGAQTTANLGNVQIATGGHAYIAGTLDNSNATLAAPTGGIYELHGGTIANGTIGAGALTFTNSGGTLSNAALGDNLTLPASTSVTFTGNTTFSGASGTLGNYSSLYWHQGGQLTGKNLTFGTGARIQVQGTGNALTLDSGTSAQGDIQITTDGSTGATITNQGNITQTVGGGSISAPSFTNSGNITASSGSSLTLSYYYGNYTLSNGSTGIITADGANTTIYLDSNLANHGTLIAQNSGTLIFDGGYYGAQTTANLGNVQIATGGHAYIAGTLDNSNATLAAPTGGIFELHGGTINNGTVGASALSFTTSGGALNNVSIADVLTLASSTYVTFTGNASFTGATGNLGNYSDLYWRQVGQLTGKSLTFGTGAQIQVQGTGDSLTLDAGTTAQGDIQITTDGSSGTAITNQGNITHTVGGGSISAPSFTNAGNITASSGSSLTIGYYYGNYTNTNASSGSITADGANTIVYLDGNLANHGTLIAQNSGALIFDGGYYAAQTTANLGNVQIATGGHAYIAGTLDNSNATLAAPTGGAYELHGGTINNGSTASGALSFTTSGGTLSGVTLLGNINLPTSSYAYFNGGTALGTTGASLTLGNYAHIYLNQSGTFAGNSISLGSGGFIELIGGNTTLTLDPGTTTSGDVSVYSDGSTGTSLTNQGNITHSNGTGYLYANSFTNAGTINVSGGTMNLGVYWTGTTIANNAGATIRLTGGNVSLQNPAASPLVNNGTIDIQSGTFFTNNRLTNGVTGAIQGAGTINGNLILSGGTLAPGNGGLGILNFSSGTLTVTGTATFAVDLGGSTSDELVFQNPPSVVNIGSGLLSLSLNLLSAPTANTTFPLISISSGGSGISGSFAGLPNSGNTLTASYAGTPYTFSINYQTNLVSLSYNPVLVPEPSEYALMSLGVLALGAIYRRRRRRRRDLA